MPLWRIFSHPSTFNTAQKQAFVDSITRFYTSRGLPAFFVNVVFVPVEAESFYIGYEQVSNMVRIVIEHLAKHQPRQEDDAEGLRAKMCLGIDKILAPHIAARKDLNWEYHVAETPRDLWKIQGIVPPPHKSAEERLWTQENKALAWQKGELMDRL